MPHKVTISATYLHWPPSCACCGHASDASRSVSRVKTRGKRVVKVTSSRSWRVPYCAACAAHSARGDLATALLVGGLTVGGGSVLLGMLASSISWLVFGLASSTIGLAAYGFLRSQATALMNPDCHSVGAAVQFLDYHRHDNEFRFRNDTYAQAFLRSNSGKRHWVVES